MKAVKFKHCNKSFAENQDEYVTLHGLQLKTDEGEFIFCMKMNFIDRVKALFLGRIWVSILTFNRSLAPSYISMNRTEHYSHPSDAKHWWEFWKWINY